MRWSDLPSAGPRLVAALLAAVLLGGCALPESAPTTFYLLDPIQPAGERAAAGAARLAVEDVGIPAYLDRQDIVTRDSETRLEVAARHQWAEPLNANVTRVLSENLRLLLDRTEVVALPSQRENFNAELQVELLRFEREAGGPVTLVAQWLVLSGGDRRELASRRAVIRQPVAGAAAAGVIDYDATVAAMSEALGELSRRIADSLKSAGAAT